MSVTEINLPESDGRLVENIAHFAHALRKAGVKVGTAQIKTAVEAVQAAGFSRRIDFYYTLRATLITRPEDLEVFHQVFAMFWRDPEFLERMIRMLSPLLEMVDNKETDKQPAQRRAADALTDDPGSQANSRKREELEVDARFDWSQNETLRAMDFEQMSAAEITEATRAIRQLSLPVAPVQTRRLIASAYGRRPDVRAMLRRSLRRGGELDRMMFRSRRYRPPNLVVLCDISGSMSVYSRMMVHFLHALVWSPNPGWGKVSSFTFSTQLTNITRALHLKDIDEALDAVGQDAPDWQGGTRIGAALHRFNRDWSRRVLGQGTVVLLITDGLEKGDVSLLGSEIDRLALSSRQLIWLNPLLRWDGFSPKAAGIRTILPFVDSFYSCHSLDSLADISRSLSGAGEKDRLMALI